MLFQFLQRVRSRPRHERRILAITTYCAAVAIVVALWSSSFMSGLNEETSEASQPRAPETDPLSSLDQNEKLTSPFEALGQSIGELVDGFRSISRTTHDLASSIEQANIATTTSPEVLPTPEQSKPPPPSISTTNPKVVDTPIKLKKETVGHITSRSFKAEDHERILGEKMYASPAAPSPDQDSGLIASTRTHANILLQTMMNAYNALRE